MKTPPLQHSSCTVALTTRPLVMSHGPFRLLTANWGSISKLTSTVPLTTRVKTQHTSSISAAVSAMSGNRWLSYPKQAPCIPCQPGHARLDRQSPGATVFVSNVLMGTDKLLVKLLSVLSSIVPIRGCRYRAPVAISRHRLIWEFVSLRRSGLPRKLSRMA